MASRARVALPAQGKEGAKTTPSASRRGWRDGRDRQGGRARVASETRSARRRQCRDEPTTSTLPDSHRRAAGFEHQESGCYGRQDGQSRRGRPDRKKALDLAGVIHDSLRVRVSSRWVDHREPGREALTMIGELVTSGRQPTAAPAERATAGAGATRRRKRREEAPRRPRMARGMALRQPR